MHWKGPGLDPDDEPWHMTIIAEYVLVSLLSFLAFFFLLHYLIKCLLSRFLRPFHIHRYPGIRRSTMQECKKLKLQWYA